MQQNNDVVVTALDAARLERLRDASGHEAENLERRLELAHVVASRQVSPDVVTMNSIVRLRDDESREESERRLVYPRDLAAHSDGVSVLSPLGQVLLGARCGEHIAAELPGGGYRHHQVLEVVFQPEAAGIYDL